MSNDSPKNKSGSKNRGQALPKPDAKASGETLDLKKILGNSERSSVKKSGDLPATAYAVLGLLSFGESSGYDLLKLAQESIRFIWNPAKSHVYGELRRLVALGCATQRDVHQLKRPDKTMYQITEKGSSALLTWLEAEEAEPEVHRNPFLLKVFFAHQLPPDLFLKRVTEYRDRMSSELELLERIGSLLKSNQKVFYPYLTLRAGVARRKAMVAWSNEALELLSTKGSTPPQKNR